MEDTPEKPVHHGDLTRRVLAWMLLLSIVPLLIMASQGYHCGKQAIVEKTNDHLLSILNSRNALVSTWFDQRFSELDVIASSPSVARCCAHFAELPEEDIDREVTAMLRSVLNRVGSYDEIAVLGRDGTVIADVARGEGRSFADPVAPIIDTVKNAGGFQMQSPERDGEGNVTICIGRAIREGGDHAGMILAKLNLTKGLDPLLQSRDGMGHTGKVYLVWVDSARVSVPGSVNVQVLGLPVVSIPVNSADSGTEDATQTRIMSEPFAHGGRIALRTAPPSFILAQKNDVPAVNLAYKDYRGKDVWARASFVKPFSIVLVVEQDTSEALAWLDALIVRMAMTGTVTIVVIVVVAIWISRRLGEPLRTLASVAQQVRAGATEERVGPLHGAEAEEVRKAFNQMLDELAAKQRELVRTATLASIGELSSSIVHEMRNPLSSIKMNLQSLKREVETDPANRELADIADAQTRRLERMLDDLLQYGRPFEVRPEPVAFDDVLKSVVAVVAEQAKAKQVTVKPQNELLKAKLLIDPEQMCRALTNLLVNAIQAAPAGGTVTVRARKDALWGNVGFIDVIDAGQGLSDEAKDRVFSPFFTTKETGAGLGLANVRKIVELHGGTVTAENANGGGAIFTIRLPLAQGAAA